MPTPEENQRLLDASKGRQTRVLMWCQGEWVPADPDLWRHYLHTKRHEFSELTETIIEDLHNRYKTRDERTALARALRDAGFSNRAIGLELAKHGFVNARSGAPLTHSAISLMLKDT